MVTKKTLEAAIVYLYRGKTPNELVQKPESGVRRCERSSHCVSARRARMSSPNHIKRQHALLNHAPANSSPLKPEPGKLAQDMSYPTLRHGLGLRRT